MDNSRYVLGGAVWINLVNTINKRMDDILDDQSRTIQWLEANNLLGESNAETIKNPELLQSLIDELQGLRSLCKEILTELEEQGTPSAYAKDQIQKLIERVHVRLTLVQAAEKLDLICQGVTLLDHVLYQIVHSMIHTLSTVSLDRIRKCEHENCILYFIDTSKSGKRRWCSMETCGNRQKAAEFYARKKRSYSN
ncbi:CGNR zinc finger domain-containing protein [Bacillus sp. BRMEA1]|uniref:CGNR zinc finger domain-containing protein n=1 Tax=Neobacillus endophyticus TaxID=2738405 RepID=UPI00156525E9|nr:CGNR zinc finger domain-containing protein [Neobacillus endophyticus]NRD79148.1 CGNR zinc finger domain-containing protein [Neobacillus endophyticus]